MFQTLNARLFLRVTKVKFQRLYSILRVQRYCLQVLIIQQGFGRLNQENYSKHYKATKTKYFLVSLIMRATL